MKKKPKRRWERSSVLAVAALTVILIIASYVYLSKNPAYTGNVVLSEEKSYEDSPGLTINESRNLTWSLKGAGNLKSVKATGAITRNGSAKIYLERGEERILIFDSTKQLFDVNVQIVPEYKKILQGDELLIQIILFNLKGFGSAQVDVRYSIKDPSGVTIATEEESLKVETQAKFIRKLLIPPDLKPGTYLAFVEAESAQVVLGTSSDLFEVKPKYEKPPINVKYYTYGIASVIALIALIAIAVYLIKKFNTGQKVAKLKERVPEERIQKLKKEIKALEDAYKSKFISEKSYKKDKERIQKELEKHKK